MERVVVALGGNALLRRGASRRIPADLIAQHPQIPWDQIGEIGGNLRDTIPQLIPQ